MVTPGGMILEQPKMVAATDVLTLIQLDDATLCVDLVTFARERHECRVQGIAARETGGTYVPTYILRRDDPLLRLTFLDADTIQVEPVGTDYHAFCERRGRIDAAAFARPR